MEGQKVRTLKACDGSNGPLPIGTVGVVLSGPNVAAELANAQTEEARKAARYRATSEAFRGHPSRAVQIATQNGWGVLDMQDLEPFQEPESEPAAEPAAEFATVEIPSADGT